MIGSPDVQAFTEFEGDKGEFNSHVARAQDSSSKSMLLSIPRTLLQ